MSANEAVVAVFSFVFLLSVIPIVGGLLHVRRERLLTHAERMKALEMGRALPDEKTVERIKEALHESNGGDGTENAPLARKCFSTAFWVAFWGFLTAAGLGGAEVSVGVAYAIASSAAAVAVTAVICGTVLAMAAAPGAKHSGIPSKIVEFDADTLDVVSCRG